MWNLPRKLKHIRNYRLTKKIFEFIECLWIGEAWIHQKYGKLRNAIIWLSGGCGTWNFQNILTTCSSICIQNFKSFWGGGAFGSVKRYGMPQIKEIKLFQKNELNPENLVLEYTGLDYTTEAAYSGRRGGNFVPLAGFHRSYITWVTSKFIVSNCMKIQYIKNTNWLRLISLHSFNILDRLYEPINGKYIVV